MNAQEIAQYNHTRMMELRLNHETIHTNHLISQINHLAHGHVSPIPLLHVLPALHHAAAHAGGGFAFPYWAPQLGAMILSLYCMIKIAVGGGVFKMGHAPAKPEKPKQLSRGAEARRRARILEKELDVPHFGSWHEAFDPNWKDDSVPAGPPIPPPKPRDYARH